MQRLPNDQNISKPSGDIVVEPIDDTLGIIDGIITNAFKISDHDPLSV